MSAAGTHRHKFAVVRRERMTGRPMVKACTCGRTWRFCYGRWVLCAPGPREAGR